MIKKYFPKENDAWFDWGTEAFIIDIYDGFNFALFEGIKDDHPDEEVCSYDEFDIVEYNEKL